MVARGHARCRDRVPRLRRSALPQADSLAQPLRRRQPAVARRGRHRPAARLVLAEEGAVRDRVRNRDHRRLADPRRHVVGHRRRRSERDPVGVLEPGGADPGRLRHVPVHRQLRDPHGPDAADGHLADPGLRARGCAVGGQARGRPRPGGGEGGGSAGRHALAVGRGLRAGGREAGARIALSRRTGDRQDDAREGDRDRVQLPVRLDPGLRLRSDLHRRRCDRRALPRVEGEAARPQVGRPVHRLHRRDRRSRDAPPGARRRRAGRCVRPGGHPRPPLLRAERSNHRQRRPDPRDPALARADVRAACARASRPLRSASADRLGAQLHVPRHGRRHGAGAQPAPGRDGRDRQSALHEAGAHEQVQHLPGRHVHRASTPRQDPASASPGGTARRPDLLHRRNERPARPARSRPDPAWSHGPACLVPDADEAGSARRLRPVHHEGRARPRARHAPATRRDRADHERLLAGDDRPGLLDGIDDRPPRRPRPVCLGGSRRGDDHDRVGNGRRDRVHRLRDSRGRDPRGRSRGSRARLHEGRRVDPPVDPHARRLARPSPGTREGRALQPLPLGRDGTAGLDAGRDGGRTGLLRRELERRRRGRAIRDSAGGVDGRRVRDGPRAVRGDAARRRDRGRGASACAEALREDRRPDHESHQRRWALRGKSDCRRPRRQRQATPRGADPRPGICLRLQPDPAEQGRGREDRGQARGAPRGLRRRPDSDPRRCRPRRSRRSISSRRKRGRGCDLAANARPSRSPRFSSRRRAATGHASPRTASASGSSISLSPRSSARASVRSSSSRPGPRPPKQRPGRAGSPRAASSHACARSPTGSRRRTSRATESS